MKSTKDLNYYKNNCEEDYINTPISVLRYITELEQALQLLQTDVSSCLDLKKADEKFNEILKTFDKQKLQEWIDSQM